VQVLQNQHHGTSVGERLEGGQVGLEEAAAGQVRRQGVTLAADRDDGLQARREVRPDQRLEPILPEPAPQPAQCGHEGTVGKGPGVLPHAGALQDRVVGGERFHERAHQAGLPSPGLPGHHDGSGALGPTRLPGGPHLVELAAPPNEWGLRASVKHQVQAPSPCGVGSL
jgi:hypothetical protein